MFRLAKDLGLTLDQVMEMTVVEFQHWAVFYKIEQDENRKSMERAKMKR